jgi:hypothetical protein
MKRMLFKIAKMFRETVESINRHDFTSRCQLSHSFPRGACGDTSMLLGKFLLDYYKIDCDYVCGSCLEEGKEHWTHAWLEYKGLKIDITADQFNEVSERVIVKDYHRLYDMYEPDPPKKISECFPEELMEDYKMIYNEINRVK